MIQIGKISKRGPVGPERYSRFTDDELITHMTFWCIYRSPLMLGGNLPDNRELELQLFNNEEVLSANQHGEDPRQLFRTDSSMAWVSHLQGSKDLFVALFNTGERRHPLPIDLMQLGEKMAAGSGEVGTAGKGKSPEGWKGKVAVRDLWQKKDMGIFKNQYTQPVNPHGAVLLRLTPQ